jgi:toxin-antitoxin system PIN domain toxin
VSVIDANLLIYAYVEMLPQHATARPWFEAILSSSTRIYLPWNSILAFGRLTTKANLFVEPYTIQEVIPIIDSWLQRPNVSVIEPGPRHWAVLHELLSKHNVKGDLVSDAHIAALAIEHDATLYSADRDFRRFTDLRVINPLA